MASGSRSPRVGLGTDQTVGALVAELKRQLAGVDDPRREATDLLAALLDVPRHWPLLHENKYVTPEQWLRACAAAERRRRGEPLAYAVGLANFRGLTLTVDQRVLIPRPETELLVDLVLRRRRGGVAVDVGTGSGAIAICLSTEGGFERVLGTDVSADALDVARVNAERAGARVELVHGDLLQALPSNMTLDAVVSNPPYIAFGETASLPPSVRDWEPAVALLSAGEGLAVTARLVRQAAVRLAPGGLLAMEVDARRASLVAELASSDGRYRDVSVHLDLAGRERFVLAARG